MRLVWLSLVAAGALLGGCKSNPYCLNCEPGADGAPIELDLADIPDMTEPPDLVPPADLTSIGDGGPCVATNAGIEKCDGIDNDCNGVTDDVQPDKLVDPNNCGACGTVCNFNAIHQFGTCVGGGDMGAPTCAPTTCMPGYINANGLPADGCELLCTPTTPNTEVCDGKDNDCNGLIDDPFTLPAPQGYNGATPLYNKDVTHCGSCAGICNLPGAVNVCKVGGGGGGVCGVDHCINNGTDTYRHNPAAGARDTTGCEVHCPFPSTTATTGSQDCDSMTCVFPPELCNGLDDNCDFTRDNAPFAPADGIGSPCTSMCPGGVCQGTCSPGSTICSSGVKLCSGGQGPVAETCDGADNDCNGLIDDPFTLPPPAGYNGTTPLYNKLATRCGSCAAAPCALANAVNGCQSPSVGAVGQCTVVSCTPGYYYAPFTACGVAQTMPKNGPTGVGCFYQCQRTGPTDLITTPSPEVCDDRDNDCNGCKNDGVTQPPNFCSNLGFCNGKNVTATCQGASGWKCNYGAVVPAGVIELDGSGNLRTTELKCDSIDGNCNGVTDLDGFPTLTQGCAVGNGICQRQGTLKCQPGLPLAAPNCRDGSNNPVTSNDALKTNEICNDQDDDCDGAIDERADGPAPFLGYRDPMVQLPSGKYVYRYEASRPDANNVSPGGNSKRACSAVTKIPWNNVTRVQAQAACAAVRDSLNMPMRLCTAAEWQTACEGPTPLPGSNLFSFSTAREVYTAAVCNDANSGRAPLSVWPTGSGPNVGGKQCFTDWDGAGTTAHLHDMSGNLNEWTSSQVVSNGQTYYQIRGGGYVSPSGGAPPDGTACEFSFVIEPDTYANADVGFRCCADNAP